MAPEKPPLPTELQGPQARTTIAAKRHLNYHRPAAPGLPPLERRLSRTQVLDGGATLTTMKTNLRRLAPLAILLAIALFPFGWLPSISPLAAQVSWTFFPHELARGIGHSLLFASLAVILLHVFPALLDHPVRFFALVLAVAIGQESFQLLYKQRGVALNDLTDIMIDLSAAGLVFGLWYSRSRRANYDPFTGCRR